MLDLGQRKARWLFPSTALFYQLANLHPGLFASLSLLNASVDSQLWHRRVSAKGTRATLATAAILKIRSRLNSVG